MQHRRGFVAARSPGYKPITVRYMSMHRRAHKLGMTITPEPDWSMALSSSSVTLGPSSKVERVAREMRNYAAAHIPTLCVVISLIACCSLARALADAPPQAQAVLAQEGRCLRAFVDGDRATVDSFLSREPESPHITADVNHQGRWLAVSAQESPIGFITHS